LQRCPTTDLQPAAMTGECGFWLWRRGGGHLTRPAELCGYGAGIGVAFGGGGAGVLYQRDQ
jgi:hypothetical protein